MKFVEKFINDKNDFVRLLLEGVFELKDKEWQRLNKFLNKVNTGYHDLFWIYILGYFASYMNSPKQAKIKQFLQDELNNDSSEFWKIFNYVKDEGKCPQIVLKKALKVIKRIQRLQPLDNIEYTKNYIKDCITKMEVSPKLRPALMQYRDGKIDIFELLQEFFVYLQKNSLRFLPIYKIFKYVTLKDIDIDNKLKNDVSDKKNNPYIGKYEPGELSLILFTSKSKNQWNDIFNNINVLDFYEKTADIPNSISDYSSFINFVILNRDISVLIPTNFPLKTKFLKEFLSILKDNVQNFDDYIETIWQENLDNLSQEKLIRFLQEIQYQLIENNDFITLYKLMQNFFASIFSLYNKPFSYPNIIKKLITVNTNIDINIISQGDNKVNIIIPGITETITADFSYKLLYEILGFTKIPETIKSIPVSTWKKKDLTIIGYLLKAYNYYDKISDKEYKNLLKYLGLKEDFDINVNKEEKLYNEFVNDLLSIQNFKKYKSLMKNFNDELFAITLVKRLNKDILNNKKLKQLFILFKRYKLFSYLKKIFKFSNEFTVLYLFILIHYLGTLRIRINGDLIFFDNFFIKVENIISSYGKELWTKIDENESINLEDVFSKEIFNILKLIRDEKYISLNSNDLLEQIAKFDDSNVYDYLAFIYLLYYYNSLYTLKVSYSNENDDIKKFLIEKVFLILILNYFSENIIEAIFDKPSLKDYPNLYKILKEFYNKFDNTQKILLKFTSLLISNQSLSKYILDFLNNFAYILGGYTDFSSIIEEISYNSKTLTIRNLFYNLKKIKEKILLLSSPIYKKDFEELIGISETTLIKLIKNQEIKIKFSIKEAINTLHRKTILLKIKDIANETVNYWNKLPQIYKLIYIQILNDIENNIKNISPEERIIKSIDSENLKTILNNILSVLEIYKKLDNKIYQLWYNIFKNISLNIINYFYENLNKEKNHIISYGIRYSIFLPEINDELQKLQKLFPEIKILPKKEINNLINSSFNELSKNIKSVSVYSEIHLSKLLKYVKDKDKVIEVGLSVINDIFNLRTYKDYDRFLKITDVISIPENVIITSKLQTYYFFFKTIDENYNIENLIDNNPEILKKAISNIAAKRAFLEFLSEKVNENNYNLLKKLIDKKIISFVNIKSLLVKKISNTSIINKMKETLYKESILPIVSKINDKKFENLLKVNNIEVDKKQLEQFIKENKINIPTIKKDLSNIDIVIKNYDEVSNKYVKYLLSNSTVKPIDNTIDELDQIAWNLAKYLQKPGIHGDTMCKILKVYNVNLPDTAYQEFKNQYSDSVKYPMFHGTGSIAANFILRFGFAITDGALIKAGRALGNGIYFTNILDKSLGYVGDSGWGRTWGIKGFLLELEVALGEKNKHYSFTNVFKSPEWCVFYPGNQIKIKKAYFVEIVKRSLYIPYLEEKFGKIEYIHF